MDKRYLYDVTYCFKEKLMDNFKRPERAIWTGATLAARVTSPYFLIIEVHGGAYEDAAIIQRALRIEAFALK